MTAPMQSFAWRRLPDDQLRASLGTLLSLVADELRRHGSEDNAADGIDLLGRIRRGNVEEAA